MLTNVLQYLENTVANTPDKLAFSDGEASLTFLELYGSARRVGTFLLEKGMQREGVAVFMKRHPSQLTAFFGAIYAGGFYVPLDDTMPAHRIELILESTKCRVIICDRKSAAAAEKLAFDGEILVLDEISYSCLSRFIIFYFRQKTCQRSFDAVGVQYHTVV